MPHIPNALWNPIEAIYAAIAVGCLTSRLESVRFNRNKFDSNMFEHDRGHVGLT